MSDLDIIRGLYLERDDLRAMLTRSRLVLRLEREARQVREDELKAEIERLRARVEDYHRSLVAQSALLHGTSNERDEARAEIERLREAEATFHEDYRRKFDVETKALHVEIERLRAELAGQRDGEAQEIVTLRHQLANALDSLKYECNQRLRAERAEAKARFLDWSGTDVPALNIALTQARAEIERLRKERSDDVSVRREQVEIITSLERERDEARAEASEAYRLFPPLLQDIDHALNGPDPEELTRRSYVPLPARAREVMAALVEARALLTRLRDWLAVLESPVEDIQVETHAEMLAVLDAALGGRDE